MEGGWGGGMLQNHGCKSVQMVDWHYSISSPSVWEGGRLASFLLLISQVFLLVEKHHPACSKLYVSLGENAVG